MRVFNICCRISAEKKIQDGSEDLVSNNLIDNFNKAIANFVKIIKAKQKIKPETISRHNALLLYIENLKNLYTVEFLKTFSEDERTKFMTALAGSIKYIKKDGVSMTVDVLRANVTEAVNTATKEILSTRLENPGQYSIKPEIKTKSPKKVLQQKSKLPADNLSLKLGNLKEKFAELIYNSLKKDQSYGGFLQEKLSPYEFDKIKAIVTELNIDQIRQEISDKGFFSIKKAAVGKESEAKQGEHSMVMEGLPRSVVITERDGELEFTILTKSKKAHSTDKDESAKFRGGNSTASRALRFTTSVEGGLEMDTVIIKTSKTKSVSEEWYQEASTDPLDKPLRAPNGMFVEDGGVPPVEKITIGYDSYDYSVLEDKEGFIKKLLKACMTLKSTHGDIKHENILVNKKGDVRIIDYPLEQEASRQFRYEKIHFKKDFEANKLSELIGQIQSVNSVSFIDDTYGTSTIGLTVNEDDGEKEVYQMSNGDTTLRELLSIPDLTHDKLLTSTDFIGSLHNAFFAHGVRGLDPRYNDVWGVLKVFEMIYSTQNQDVEKIKFGKLIVDLKKKLEGATGASTLLSSITESWVTKSKREKSIDEKLLKKIFHLQRDLLTNFADLLDQIPEPIRKTLVKLDQKALCIGTAIKFILDELGSKTSDEILRSFHILNEHYLPFEDLIIDISSWTKESIEDSPKLVQDFLATLISHQDRLFEQIESITLLPFIKNLTDKMNEKWSFEKLAHKMEISVETEALHQVPEIEVKPKQNFQYNIRENKEIKQITHRESEKDTDLYSYNGTTKHDLRIAKKESDGSYENNEIIRLIAKNLNAAFEKISCKSQIPNKKVFIQEVIEFAQKHDGVGNANSYKHDLSNFEAAKEFSYHYQKLSQEKGFYTGRESNFKEVGARLKRIPPEINDQLLGSISCGLSKGFRI
ncbi:hypothetical protein OAP83_00350 [Rickettsiales bacterium]|nr:hypothetical protein [Rickettsiales bacterium]